MKTTIYLFYFHSSIYLLSVPSFDKITMYMTVFVQRFIYKMLNIYCDMLKNVCKIVGGVRRKS